MVSKYPNAIDGYSDIRVVRDGIEEVLARDHNDNRSAIVKLEQTLGLNPQGTFGTVAARLNFQIGSVVPAAGDLSGNYPNPSVSGLQGDILPPKAAGGFLKRNGANSGWEEVIYGTIANTVCQGDDSRLADSRIPSGPAGGDLAGTYPNPSVIGLDGYAIDPSQPVDGYALTWSVGQNRYVSSKPVPGGPAGGDLSGMYPKPIVTGLQGQHVTSAIPLDGYALVWNDVAKVWSSQVQDGYRIQNRKISPVPPIDGYALTWNGYSDEWQADKPTPGGPAGGDLAGTYPNPTIPALTVAQASPDNLNATGYEFKRQLLVSPTVVSIGGTSTRNTLPLTAGRYKLAVTVNCAVKQGDGTVVAITTDYPLGAGEESRMLVVTSAADGYFAAITGGASGFLFIKSAEEL